MEAIVVSDLHLTDRLLDEYRWRLFSQLEEISLRHTQASDLWILGDLTEFKDYHSSRLVNRIVNALYWLRRRSKINEVHILKGNHDGIDPNTPYFGFLERLPWAHFYARPHVLDKGRDRIGILPHTRTFEQAFAEAALADSTHLLLHATFRGAEGEMATRLPGADAGVLSGTRALILSGDVHVPQKLGPVEYVGAPYPIKFGDHFRARAIVVSGRRWVSEPLENIRKLTVTLGPAVKEDPPELRPGDQVKIRIQLSDSEFGSWQRWKRLAQAYCTEQRAVLCGVQLDKLVPHNKSPSRASTKLASPSEALDDYCRRQRVQKSLREVGQELLKL